MSLVSFIILTHNSESYVINCLNSILEQDYLEKEIIIVDNNSTDKTWELIDNFKIKNSIQINVIKNKSNLGYNLGNLEGIKKSTGKFIALINPDVILTKNWTSEIIQKFRDDLTAAVCGKILNFDNSIQSTGGQLDIYCTPQQRKNSNLFVNEDFFYITGAAFVFTKSLLTKLELDPNLFIYYEDVDLSWGIRLFGSKIEYCDNALAYHVVGHSNPHHVRTKYFHITKNRIYVCLKKLLKLFYF